MHDPGYIITAVIILFLVIFITRALPFIFSKQMQHNILFDYLGARLPSCIIFMLVIYYVFSMTKPTHWHTLPWHICALAITLLVQWLWRNMIVSIIIGTAAFLLLSNI